MPPLLGIQAAQHVGSPGAANPTSCGAPIAIVRPGRGFGCGFPSENRCVGVEKMRFSL
jgi:hypothetical protein